MLNLWKSDHWLKGSERVMVCLTFTNGPSSLPPSVRHPQSTAPTYELGQRSMHWADLQGTRGGPQSGMLPTEQQTAICHWGPASVCDEPPHPHPQAAQGQGQPLTRPSGDTQY